MPDWRAHQDRARRRLPLDAEPMRGRVRMAQSYQSSGPSGSTAWPHSWRKKIMATQPPQNRALPSKRASTPAAKKSSRRGSTGNKELGWTRRDEGGARRKPIPRTGGRYRLGDAPRRAARSTMSAALSRGHPEREAGLHLAWKTTPERESLVTVCSSRRRRHIADAHPRAVSSTMTPAIASGWLERRHGQDGKSCSPRHDPIKLTLGSWSSFFVGA